MHLGPLNADALTRAVPSIFVSVGLLIAAVVSFSQYLRQKEMYEGLGPSVPNSHFEAVGRAMTLAKSFALLCASIWTWPVVLRFNIGHETGEFILQELGYGVFGALVVGGIARLMKILVSRPYLNELKVSVFLLFSVVGLIVILVGVSVYDLRTNPCLLREIKKSAVDLVKPGGGKE